MTLKKLGIGLATGVAMVLSTVAGHADGHGELTVAYFLEWPTPNQFAQMEGLYEEALGMKVNFVSFDAGTAMSAAMASGDVQISFSRYPAIRGGSISWSGSASCRRCGFLLRER